MGSMPAGTAGSSPANQDLGHYFSRTPALSIVADWDESRTLVHDHPRMRVFIRNAEQVNRATVGAGEIVVRDNPGQDLSSLNRDTDKAQEVLKDEHKGEDLYVSSNSVEKVGQAVELVGNAVPAFIEGVQRAQTRKELTTGTADERSDAARKLLQYQVGNDADTTAGKAVSDRLADLARQDPAAAAEALNLIAQIQNSRTPPGSQNLTQFLEIGAVALIAAAVGGVVVSSNPEYRQKVADALAALPDAQKRQLEDVINLLGTEGLPIHKGDLGKYIFPVADQGTWQPGSTGYGADGKVELPVSTGGSEAQPNGAWDTGSQPEQVASPGNMYSGSGDSNALDTTKPVAISGDRAIDKAQSYESGVRDIYGATTSFEERQFRTVVDGKIVNGVADDVAVIGGKRTAVEAKFVEDWDSSIRNPASAAGAKPWAVAEQSKMIDQAKKYSSGFDGGVVYHTNSPELASYYSKVFSEAGVANFKFVITPTKN